MVMKIITMVHVVHGAQGSVHNKHHWKQEKRVRESAETTLTNPSLPPHEKITLGQVTGTIISPEGSLGVKNVLLSLLMAFNT